MQKSIASGGDWSCCVERQKQMEWMFNEETLKAQSHDGSFNEFHVVPARP